MANEKTLLLDALLKSSPEVSSLDSNDRILAVDSDGGFKRMSSYLIPRSVDLSRAEPAKTVLGIKDFALKYVTGLPVGSVLTDMAHSHAIDWSVKAADYSFNTQEVVFVVLKNTAKLTGVWARCNLRIQDLRTNRAWVVDMETGRDSSEYSEYVAQISGGKFHIPNALRITLNLREERRAA